jgi:hypothetical protein
LSDVFIFQNDLKQGDALSSLLFNSVLKHANTKVQENQEELEQDTTHQLPVCPNELNLVDENMNITQIREILLDDINGVSTEVN